MLPKWLSEFLQLNPFPSLSFLPIQKDDKSESEVSFFYQAPDTELKKLIGTINIKISFYEEPHAYIMRFEFYPIIVSKIETPCYSASTIELEFPYIETEFFKNEKHIEALHLLSNQSNFMLFLCDTNSGFLQQKLIDFTQGRQLLEQFFKNRNI